MLRKNLSSSRLARVGVFGLLTVTTAVIFTTDAAEARRHRRHYAHHRVQRDVSESSSPKFASIIVDGNSGSVLQATSPDGIRHPASLTKIMTLYLLFERLESGKMKLDTEMPVSQHAADQDPTKLNLRAGQTIRVEDAIKGLVTRSANDAAVVIAEAIAGDEDDFAQMMTRKARSLGMSKTVYRNANGLPNDEQVTTARDQATLGRAIQERFPRYYRYFATSTFNWRGQSIRNHNHLLGSVEGVDGIKTGYTRASGFNLVTSMRRGNRHLIGVVLGGRSGGSRDAIMRNLLAENLDKGATSHTVAAVTERSGADAAAEVADASDTPARTAPQVQAAAAPAPEAAPSRLASRLSTLAAATAAMPPAQPKPEARPTESKIEPAPLTNGVISSQPLSIIPGSSEPMKPVRVKTVQVKAGTVKVASAAPSQVAPQITNTVASRSDVAETSGAVVARADLINKPEIQSQPEAPKAEVARTELPRQPAGFGTGNGVLGVLPAATAAAPAPVAPKLASADPAPQAIQMSATTKPVVTHSGWIVQVGALESENEAQQRIDAARSSARGLLSKADPFTEPVVAKDNRKLYRARFAGLERDQAEAVCRALKRADISCITVRN
ncbi:D-alanyl-D-alanine carboxypeptidase [Bradyrhizobium diazoefficiens]|uniref:Blr5156 protein n=1 Tax=Bradyrhizobium diazoefficiens (strain JCM 10833 / BCRC 13528 / IAM 13628 / NBRC 14792 / USDA 110) TaxID=224911 RepID=Q89JW3_BRADU|nr:D-alanyl-D-alanine carboxypeptidase [Bradyrhizobium diazoefficiens]AND90363.1 peptidase M15 [Bradyrhizobium diazoefficiens USDA 110]PDT59721.1 D-alanyl-D-alanine carboxypeptidase [Bradyrhizobium diazoefficiens]QBP23938.1 D-alanyl-D-alanine carboxypeptidase [Bradyrhizobium diazoefficiens]QLD43067.1 D-alanyl-D-alanine carboxypeptidase [Bradyrhizobium diazoefficiens]WLB35316.1 D-alanyl-D-alanine carboxypeptidase [Bradyrhizobium diazoefficiens]